MTIPEILKQLEPYTGKFPMEAMRAAIDQREAITPELLKILESVAADPAEWVATRKNNELPLFASHLLAQFRDKAAYPLLVKIVSAPGEIPFDLFGDTITEGLCQLLASVYDGNPTLLHGLIENEQINEYVRSAALDAFLVLEHTGLMPRDAVIDYFRSLFHGRLQRIPSYAWSSLVCDVADLPAPELLEEVRQAYADGFVDAEVADLPSIERDLRHLKARGLERRRLITDAIAEMEGWACYHLEDSEPETSPKCDLPARRPLAKDDSPEGPTQPYIREPKVGRNDPCPCGSGKKYKKCCGK